LMAPITDLTKGLPRKFVWTKEANNAFLQLKSILTAAPVLTMPEYSEEFVIFCDASDIGVGATLAQGGETPQTQRTVAYFSQKLTSCQKRYSVTERECLAVLLAIGKFRHFIQGTHFTVITDHSALQWLLAMKTPVSNRLCRWIMELQQYDFTIKHRKGKNMEIADGLSRAIETIDITIPDDWYEGLSRKIIKDPEKYPDFRLEGARILKFCKKKNDLVDSEFVWKLVVPRSNVQKVLKENHDDCAHHGVQKTFARIQQRFYWAKMFSNVEDYVANCEICRKSKISRRSNVEPMGKPKVVSSSWRIISVDFIGPLPRSKKGNTDLLVVSDWFSKYVICLPMRSQCSKKMVEFLEKEVFLKFSVPEKIISDNGVQFKSKVYKELLEKYAITPLYSASYHAQNNPVERVNAVIGDSIRVYLGNDQREWDVHLPKIIWAINTSVHSVTKFTPHFLNFGKEIKISGFEHKMNAPPDLDIMTKTRAEDMEKIQKIVAENMKKSHENSAKRYNMRARPKSYDVGDTVYRKNFKQSDASKHYAAKLGDRHVKCLITKRIGSNTYQLADFDTGKDVGVFSSKDFFK
jgi:hypothetical protein